MGKGFFLILFLFLYGFVCKFIYCNVYSATLNKWSNKCLIASKWSSEGATENLIGFVNSLVK